MRRYLCVATRTGETEQDFEIGLWQLAGGTLGPLDQTDAVTAKVLVKACIPPFYGISEPIKIKVV